MSVCMYVMYVCMNVCMYVMYVWRYKGTCIQPTLTPKHVCRMIKELVTIIHTCNYKYFELKVDVCVYTYMSCVKFIVFF